MLRLTKGITSDIIVTFTENKTLSAPNYLLVFEHVTLKTKVKTVLVADLSAYPNRYNQFTINTGSLFTEVGQYIYKAYEQVSSSNTDETGLNMVEQGKAEVIDNVDFTYRQYTPATTYSTYGG